MDADQEYLSLEQAAEYLHVSTSVLRRVLREHGLGEFMRASMAKNVLIRRSDVESLRHSARLQPKGRNIA